MANCLEAVQHCQGPIPVLSLSILKFFLLTSSEKNNIFATRIQTSSTQEMYAVHNITKPYSALLYTYNSLYIVSALYNKSYCGWGSTDQFLLFIISDKG